MKPASSLKSLVVVSNQDPSHAAEGEDEDEHSMVQVVQNFDQYSSFSSQTFTSVVKIPQDKRSDGTSNKDISPTGDPQILNMML